VPEFFMIVGCPTAETIRTGTDTDDYDRGYFYAEDGRLARVERRNPTSNEVQETFLVFYDDDDKALRIDHTRGTESVAWDISGESSEIHVTATDGHFNFTLDAEGRTTALARGAFPGDTSEQQSWSWRRDKLESITHENASGRVIAETEFSYDCR